MSETNKSIRCITKLATTGVPSVIDDLPGETRSEDTLKMAAPSDWSLASATGPLQLLPDGLSPTSPQGADPTVLERNSHRQWPHSQET